MLLYLGPAKHCVGITYQSPTSGGPTVTTILWPDQITFLSKLRLKTMALGFLDLPPAVNIFRPPTCKRSLWTTPYLEIIQKIWNFLHYVHTYTLIQYKGYNCSNFLMVYSSEMVFCYQNCSDLLWEKIVLLIEKNFFWDH